MSIPTRKRYDTFSAKIGDRVVWCEGEYQTHFTVWLVEPAGAAGRSYSAGPVVHAHTRPGGYGLTFDALSYRGDGVVYSDEN